MPPESKNTIKYVQSKFGEVAADVQKYKRQGEVVLVGYFNSRIGQASKLSENIGQYGEVTKNKNGEQKLKFFKHNKGVERQRKKKAKPAGTRQCIRKGGSSIFDYIVVENGSGKETELHVCAAAIATTDHCPI
ncbi:MAG: hypothetical protein ABJJ26_08050 [Algoriphagus sp.]|uniref:hypothetical protein n=1 Tax=Algoriphagus sp. TaxID=1872435 RepID=UPI003296AE3D